MNKYILIGVSILALLVIGIVGMNTYKLMNSEWTCIAQECVEFAEGDDWVKQNCNHQNGEMICSFEYEGEAFSVPLSGLNISNMISCKEYKCASMVLVSYAK